MADLLNSVDATLPGPIDLQSEDVQPGAILWLPTHEEVMSSKRARTGQRTWCVSDVTLSSKIGKVPEHLYKHPIVVLFRHPRKPDAMHFLLLTSFSKKALQTRNKREIAESLPLTPSPDHPYWVDHQDARYRTRTFEDGIMTGKTGYVRISKVFHMSWHDAQTYWAPAGKPKLDEQSTRRVLAAVARFVPRFAAGLQTPSSVQISEPSHESVIALPTPAESSYDAGLEIASTPVPVQRPNVYEDRRASEQTEIEPLLPVDERSVPEGEVKISTTCLVYLGVGISAIGSYFYACLCCSPRGGWPTLLETTTLLARSHRSIARMVLYSYQPNRLVELCVPSQHKGPAFNMTRKMRKDPFSLRC